MNNVHKELSFVDYQICMFLVDLFDTWALAAILIAIFVTEVLIMLLLPCLWQLVATLRLLVVKNNIACCYASFKKHLMVVLVILAACYAKSVDDDKDYA
ncbi:hypothetical protein EB796_012505 [Bugula neritina]|uniref:Uncharacterized protein n=1 Tax=Bugula neritina TaxID=10212 RepID=A0A7J7JT79_BUGNE|nr:hypothetical protein EB796_012505 [Bugula neritina]